MKGSELRQLRAVLGLTQEGLGRLVGVHKNSIARQERGAMKISEPLARLVRLLAGAHMEIERLKRHMKDMK